MPSYVPQNRSLGGEPMSGDSSFSGGVPDPDRIVTQQDFGRALTLLRNRAGLTVRQVARASGLPASTVPPPGVTRAAVRRLATEHDSGSYVFSVAFSPDGQTLAAASADGLTRLWSVRDPARPVPLGAPLTGPASYAYSVAFSPDGKTLAAGVTDGTVWLWNLTVPAHPSLVATITGPNGHVYSVAFSRSGQVVAAGSADGTVRLWDTSAAQAASAVCANEGQPLSRAAWQTSVPGISYRVPCS
jgi:WD40 repeat protein